MRSRQLGVPTHHAPPCRRRLPQRLLKDCEEKAEAARRPSAQQLPQQQAANSAAQRRSGPGNQQTGASSEDGESDGKPAAAAAAGVASSSGGSADHSSDDDESADGGPVAANGAAGDSFVPNLDKLKKLGKRAGPGGKVQRHQADRAEEPKKKAPARKGKQARVWDDAGGVKGEPAARLPPTAPPCWSGPLQRHCSACAVQLCCLQPTGRFVPRSCAAPPFPCYRRGRAAGFHRGRARRGHCGRRRPQPAQPD